MENIARTDSSGFLDLEYCRNRQVEGSTELVVVASPGEQICFGTALNPNPRIPAENPNLRSPAEPGNALNEVVNSASTAAVQVGGGQQSASITSALANACYCDVKNSCFFSVLAVLCVHMALAASSQSNAENILEASAIVFLVLVKCYLA